MELALPEETREGDVFKRLFEKLDEQRQSLGGLGIFDILGKLFRDRSRFASCLIEAVRYGATSPKYAPDFLRRWITCRDREHCEEKLLDDRALAA